MGELVLDTHKKNLQQGQALIFTLGLSSLLMVSSLGLYSMIHTLFERKKKIHFCRKALVDIQTELSHSMVELLKLNPQAKKLRRKKLLALHAVSAAPEPISKSIALAHLAKVQLEQSLFRTQQKSIIFKAKAKAQNKKLYYKLKNKLQFGPTPFALRPKLPFSFSPSYQLATSFTRKQEIKAQIFSPHVSQLTCRVSLKKSFGFLLKFKPQVYEDQLETSS